MTEPTYPRGDDAPLPPTGPATRPVPAQPPEHVGSGSDAPGGERPELTVERTRTGGLWVAAIAAVVVILLLLIFILQNMEQVEVALFGANPDLPLGIALLLAAVLGALIVALIGTARIVQLRMLARRHRGADRKADRRR